MSPRGALAAASGTGTLRWAVAALALTLLAILAAPVDAVALTGTQLLTFGDYETGTEISTQYQGQGVIFKDEDGYYPEIRWDESAFTNPVLSGTFGFGSPIKAEFVTPGTTTPATVENLAMDVGYINELDSTEVIVDHAAGGPSEIWAEDYGFDRLSAAGAGISGFEIETASEEPAGWTLDNLEFTIPAPPAPPPPPPPPPPSSGPSCPSYAIYDSRGSGEPRGEISKPGKDFLQGFKARLADLRGPSNVSVVTNPYNAVGVWSWSPFGGAERLNAIGALLHNSTLGAYEDSERGGEKQLERLIDSQVHSSCSSSGPTKIVMLGYSQGAEATGNVYQGLSASARGKVAAVVLWGDPHYNHGDNAADRDDRDHNGLLGTRPPFKDGAKVFSYCNTHDPICQYPLLPHEYAWYRTKEHDLYWQSDEAKNDGSAVASFLMRGR